MKKEIEENLIKKDEELYTKINNYYSNYKLDTNSLLDYIVELKNKDEDYISEIKTIKIKEILNIISKLNDDTYEEIYNYVFETEKKKIIDFLNSNTFPLKKISKKLIDDSEEIQILIINFVIKNDLKILTENISDNKKIMFELLNHNSFYYNYLSENLKEDKEFIISLINKNSSFIRLINKKYLDDNDIVKLIIDKYPEKYSYISLRLKNDRNLALQALKKVNIYDFLPETFKNDLEFINEGLSYGNLFSRLNEKQRSDKKIILEALKYDNDVIKNIYFENKDEEKKEFFTDKMIEEILKVNGLVIKDFDKDIRSNKKYALIAVKQNPKSINYINKLLYSDYEIVMSALEKDASLIKIVNTVDYNMALKLIKENSNNIYLLNNYSSDYDIALEAVKKDGYKISAINIDANNFEQYNKLALEAVKQNGKALKFVSKYSTYYSDIC